MQKFLKEIKNAKKVALFSHISPDPDTIGSTTALCLALRNAGKEVSLFCGDEVPEKYYFLPETKEYNKNENLENFDLLVSVDISTGFRLGKYEEAFLKHENTIKIDHHAVGDDFAKINEVRIYSACAVFVYEVLHELNIKLTPEIATRLMFGLVGDTGTFHFANTDAQSFKVAGDLMEKGADLPFLYANFFDRKTISYVKMSSNCLLGAEINEKLGYAILTAKADDYKKFGLAQKNDNLSNVTHQYLNCGLKIAVIIKEYEDSVHVSLRSKGDYDVTVIAEKFGGGGHKNASGIEIHDTPFDEVKKNIKKEIEKYLKTNCEK